MQAEKRSPKLIGVGLGRTGTQSMVAALEAIDVPCYGMRQVISSSGHADAWGRALVEGQTPVWAELLGGWGATMGWPMCFFAEELAEAFPDARFVLTLREPEDWFQSMEGSWGVLSRMQRFRFIPKVRKVLGVVEPIMGRVCGVPPDRQRAVQGYAAHVAQVRSVVPPDRLIECEVSEGWEPLCRALDRPVPALDFPHANSGRGMLRRMVGQLISGKS